MGRMTEGFKITVDIDGVVTPLFDEVEVTPPGFDNGEPIDIMHQRVVGNLVIKAPRSTIEIDDGQFTAAYDPAAIAQIRAVAGVNKEITYTYPNGYTILFCGYVRSFKPTGGMSRGNRPLATIVMVTTNIDPTTGAYTPPVETPPTP